jgi:hypothetical protein
MIFGMWVHDHKAVHEKKKRTLLYSKPAASFVSIVMYFILKTTMDLKITIWENQLF